ncbi:MAG: radical SAM family heme chaperone HemW [Gemmatimonadaceae bacterium]
MSARHLYVHVPFCTRRCSYCDFSIAVRKTVPVEEYLKALARELAALPPNSGALETVYLGGGTPSRLGPDGIGRLLDLVRSRFEVGAEAEVTLEANPEDFSAESLAAWRAAGVNRLSIGIQSFEDTVLAWMHRVHSAPDARRAIELARDAGITNFSIDLIFALPRAVGRDWKRDLESALSYEPPHISLYGLTIEQGTPLARWQTRGLLTAPEDEQYAGEFLLADEMAVARGYSHYEVSNFALPGMESRHNSAYWTGASYIGVGPSAHSFDGETRRWNVGAYADWVRRLNTGEPVRDGEEKLSEGNRASERVYLGLRTITGLRASERDLVAAEEWLSPGWARIDDGVVRLTPEGWLRLDSLAAGLTGF